jgi:hypothetical protein
MPQSSRSTNSVRTEKLEEDNFIAFAHAAAGQ